MDLVLPERFDLTYTGDDGRPHRPVMLHRSIVSTMERMVAHLLEVHDGRLPAWLAPVQLGLLPVGDSDVTVLRDRFVAAGVRVDIAADGTLGRRIRDARRVPWLAVVGPEEAAAQAVALRSRHGSKTLPVAEAVSEVAASVAPPPSVPGQDA